MRGQGTERGAGRKGKEQEEDRMEEQERAPSFLSARELLAQDPARPAGKEPARGAQKRVHRLLSDDEEGSAGKADDQDSE